MQHISHAQAHVHVLLPPLPATHSHFHCHCTRIETIRVSLHLSGAALWDAQDIQYCCQFLLGRKATTRYYLLTDCVAAAALAAVYLATVVVLA